MCLFPVSYCGIGIRNFKHGCPSRQGNIDAILKMRRPRTCRELYKAVGAAQFYSSFIPNFALMTKPFRPLLASVGKPKQPGQARPATVIKWSDELDTAWKVLRRCLASSPVLQQFDADNKQVIVAADSSKFGIGSVLLQENSAGQEHPVAYHSYAFTEVQARWPTWHQEFFAVFASVAHWEPLLRGRAVEIRTDNRVTELLLKMRQDRQFKLPDKIVRWILYLSGFAITVRWIKGEANHLPDLLSRLVAEPAALRRLAGDDEALGRAVGAKLDVHISYVCAEEVSRAQRHSRITRFFLQLYDDGGRDPDVPEHGTKEEGILWRKLLRAQQAGRLQVVNGTLHILGHGQRNLPVIPPAMELKLLLVFHDLRAHPGARETCRSLMSKCWFPLMDKKVKRHVSRCMVCLRRASPGKEAEVANEGDARSGAVAHAPRRSQVHAARSRWEEISARHCGPCNKVPSSGGCGIHDGRGVGQAAGDQLVLRVLGAGMFGDRSSYVVHRTGVPGLSG